MQQTNESAQLPVYRRRAGGQRGVRDLLDFAPGGFIQGYGLGNEAHGDGAERGGEAADGFRHRDEAILKPCRREHCPIAYQRRVVRSLRFARGKPAKDLFFEEQMRFTALVALLQLAALSLEAQTTRHTLPGAAIGIYNLVGTIRVVPGTGNDVLAEVTRVGADASRLRVETGPIGNMQTLRVIFPADEISYRGLGRWYGMDRMTVRDDGTFGNGRGGRRVRITGRPGGLNAAAEITVQVPPGKTIAVHIGAGEASVKNVNGDILVDAASANVAIEGTTGRLRLDAGSGELSVSDANGDLSLDAGSGEVQLARIRSGRISVDAGSGALRGDDIEAAEITADLGSGSTRLTRVKSGELHIDSGSGSVDLELTSDVQNAVIEAGSGSVTLRIPELLGATLEIETGSGGIDTDFPLTLTSRSRSHMRATLGDGRGRIAIETGSGGVRLRRS